MKSLSFTQLLHAFFHEWMAEQHNLSHHTVLSYRDTWRLFLRFVSQQKGRPVARLALADLDAMIILAFLRHCEIERKVSVGTRNCRLAALRVAMRRILSVTKLISYISLVYFVPLLLVTLPVAAAVQPNDTNLRAADAEELRNVLTGDANAMRSLMHPNYMVNSPVNQIVRKDQLIELLSEGKIASEAIERTIEATAITGNVGIVMGRETIKPKANSELGLVHGVKILERRFTNVFVFEQGNWRLLARQSTVIQASPQ